MGWVAARLFDLLTEYAILPGMTYRVKVYDELDPRARRLYDWLVRFHVEQNGRRASHREMMAALGLSKEPLLDLLAILTAAGLFEVDADAQGKARSYKLPGAESSHPHWRVLQARRAFFVGSTVD